MEKSLFRRFISSCRPHRKMLALDLGAAFLISATGMVYPVVTNRMLNDYIPNRMYRTIVIAGAVVLALVVGIVGATLSILLKVMLFVPMLPAASVALK